MKAVITRPMKVAGDNGGIVSFNPATEDELFVIVSDTVFSRLRRAGAAMPYSEPVPEAETGAKDKAPQGKSKKK